MARLSDRFWEKVDRQGPVHPILGTRCWLWTGAGEPGGYGRLMMVRDGKKQVEYAHRLVWEINGRVLVDDERSLHRCDVPRCVNPDHLFIGTMRDNSIDAVIKGRWTTRRLTQSQVDEIVAARRTAGRGTVMSIYRQLAERFGVSASYARQVASGHARRQEWQG